jgi:hypothetical protein
MKNGRQEWRQNGKLHRLDGPAVIYPNGRQEWWMDGDLHREDGPAIIDHDDSQMWYQYGRCHRLNGPAVVGENGRTHLWFFDNVYLGAGIEGFWALWNELNSDQRDNAELLKYFASCQ